MPYLPQDFRPVPGMPTPPPPTLAPTETTLPAPAPAEEKPRPDKPRYRTFRPKEQMLPKLSILNYAPDQQQVVDQMLRGGRRK